MSTKIAAELKVGNAVTLKVKVADKFDNIINDLSTAEEITFMIKTELNDDDTEAKIHKRKTEGEIIVDSPETGYLSIYIDSEDATVDYGFYYWMVEVKYSNIKKTEFPKKPEKVYFIQDGIRG
jgi:hypothetical protein